MSNSGLVYLKEVAKYFMDFLETDFHKHKTPKRSIKLRNENNLLMGVELSKYPSFTAAIWRSVKDSFGSNALKQIPKGTYRSNIPTNLFDLIRRKIKNIPDNDFDTLSAEIAKTISGSAAVHLDEFDRALTEALDETATLMGRLFIAPLIDSIAKSLETADLGGENSQYMMTEELSSVLNKTIEPKINELIKGLIAGEELDVREEISSALEVDEIKRILVEFFEGYQTTDLYDDIVILASNKSILENQSIYLCFCDVTYRNVKYPLFYLPFDLAKDKEVFSVSFGPHVYINKKALEYIAQEYCQQAGLSGGLKSIKERTIYLGENQQDFVDVLTNVHSEIAGFFMLDRAIDITNNAIQKAKSIYLLASNRCYLTIFDKSDESLVNDYEAILCGTEDENSGFSLAFQKIIDGFLHDDPEVHTSKIEKEWDDLSESEKLVTSTPVSLNEEQRQILMATKRPGCNFITVGGPPGTGKSHTITAVVCDCVLNGKSVLVLSDKKEALDVVENKIADTINKIRNDKNFQNPILRLGKSGNTYAQILSAAVLDDIKTHCRAVRNNSSNLNDDIDRDVKSLKAKIQCEIAANEKVSLRGIARCTLLESRFARATNLPIDLEECLKSADASEDLTRLRQTYNHLKNVLFDEKSVERSQIFAFLGFDSTECHESNLLHCLAKQSEGLVAVIAHLKERYTNLGIIACCERFSSADLDVLHGLIRTYDEMKNRFFGYLFCGNKIKALNEQFKMTLPLVNINEPFKDPARIKEIAAVYNYIKANQPDTITLAKDFVEVIDYILKNEAALTELNILVSTKTDLNFIEKTIDNYPKSKKLLGVKAERVIDRHSNRLTSMPAAEFDQLIEYLTICQKTHLAFSNIEEFDYQSKKVAIEKMATIKMSYEMDQRVVEFVEKSKATATALRKIIQKKQKFPQDEFSKLKEAFPCILSSIRDYAEYIPLQTGMFDLVIIDEASQVSIAQAFPALLRAKKVLILGDKKQFSNVKSLQARSDINREYLNSLRDSFLKNVSSDPQKLVRQEIFNIKTSVLDFFEYISNYHIQLNKHFRGYKELISYSNRNFYGNRLQVMKLRGKAIDDVLKFSFIEHDGKGEPVANSNKIEIDFILAELKRLKESGSQVSVGIITPHTNQQKLIMDAISKLPEKDHYTDEFKLKVMTFDTCQGEERDIIYYSMVATQQSDRLWGIFIKDMATVDVEEDGKIKAQRLNVGLSRAKECMHFVLSKPLSEYKGSIGEALNHYWNELESGRNEPLPDSVDPTSAMEKEVLSWILQTSFWIYNKGLNRVSLIPQFNIGEYLRQLDPTRAYQHPKYKVDFLLIYKTMKGNEQKIIIEYDGFKEHFKNYSEVNEFIAPVFKQSNQAA